MTSIAPIDAELFEFLSEMICVIGVIRVPLTLDRPLWRAALMWNIARSVGKYPIRRSENPNLITLSSLNPQKIGLRPRARSLLIRRLGGAGLAPA
jgi:hypothetical protein